MPPIVLSGAFATCTPPPLFAPLATAAVPAALDSNEVAGDEVPRAGDVDADIRVARDDVAAGGGGCAADRVPRGARVDDHAGHVGQRHRARDVRPDHVARHEGARRADPGDLDAVARVARDQVAGTGNRATHGIARRSDEHAIADVAERRGPAALVPM